MEQLRKKVSIVVCTYNGSRYIRQQLDSIINQTYPLYEIIIQDDLSSDDTETIVKEYIQKYPYISFFKNSKRLGYNLNFKTASMKATGDFVALSDQDDVWMPQKIEMQMMTIKDHDICFSSHLCGTDMEHTNLVSSNYSLEKLVFEGFAGHTMLLRRDFIQQDSVWIKDLYYDWSLAINAQLRNGIVKIEAPLNWHRSHVDSAAQSQHSKYFPNEREHRSFMPYLYGLSSFRKLQQEPLWNRLYTFIYDNTNKEGEKTTHMICKLMLRHDTLSLLRLCFVCMVNREYIYPNTKACKGIMGLIRGFFFPLIFSYHNTTFYLESKTDATSLAH